MTTMFSKKHVLLGLFSGVLILASFGIFFPNQGIGAVMTSVEDLTNSPETYEGKLVQITGEVVTWEEEIYTVTITSTDFEESNQFTRDYLLIQDLETSAIIFVRINHGFQNDVISDDFISLGEIITVTGLSRNVEFLREDWEADQVLLASKITNSSNESIDIVSAKQMEPFKQYRQTTMIDEAETLVGQVVTWETKEFNVTISSETYYDSFIVIKDVLIIQEESTNELIYVQTQHRRLEAGLPSDFISVGESVSILGLERTVQSNGPIFEFLSNDSSTVFVAFSVTNSDGETYQIVNLDAMGNYCHIRAEHDPRNGPGHMFGPGKR